MTKDKITWLAIAGLAIFGAGFVLALVITKAPAPSAAATVRRTLLGLILAPVALGGGFVALKHWWERRERRRRLEDIAMQAQALGMLRGTPPQRPQRLPQRERGDGVNIILAGGGEQNPQRPITLDALTRAVEATRRRD